jgi:hypothetical protein
VGRHLQAGDRVGEVLCHSQLDLVGERGQPLYRREGVATAFGAQYCGDQVQDAGLGAMHFYVFDMGDLGKQL